MMKWIRVLGILGLLLGLLSSYILVQEARAAMQRFYFVPVTVYSPEPGDAYRRPTYIYFPRFNPTGIDIGKPFGFMDYGALNAEMNVGLLLALGITQAAHDQLVANADVIEIPEDLDSSLDPADMQSIRDNLEAWNLPANWITPSNSYRELMRREAGMFHFCQRYFGMHDVPLFPAGVSYDLDTRYRDLPADVQQNLLDTATNLGYDTSEFRPNNDLRQMMRRMGDEWGDRPFNMMGITF